MTKFESVGVEIQQLAKSKADAMQKFKNSCDICCYRGMHIDCDCCMIANANALTIAAFDKYHIK